MKLSGDVSQKDKDIANELEQFEKIVDSDIVCPVERLAQIYVCLAHDWYKLSCEEEGNRLLLKAEKICPGYFKSTVIEHQKEDKDFDIVVRNITIELITMMVSNLK